MQNEPDALRAKGWAARWCGSHRRLLTWAACLLLFMVVVGLLDSLAEHRLQRRIRAIQAMDEPVIAEDLAARLPPVPEDENMTLIVLRHGSHIADILTKWDKAKESKLLPFVGSGVDRRTGRRFSPERAEAARRYLDDIADDLVAIRKALLLDRGSLNVQWTSPLAGVDLPDLIRFTLISRSLSLEAALAANDGDGERAAEAIEQMIRLDRAIRAFPFLLGALLRTDNLENTQQQAIYAVNLCGLSDAALQRISERLGEVEKAIDFKEAVACERLFLIDHFAHLERNRWRTPLTRSQVAWWLRLPVLPSLDFAEAVRIETDMVDAIEGPDAASVKRFAAASQQTNAAPAYYHFARTGVPSLTGSFECCVKSIALNRAARAAIACERYRLAEGRWPGELEVVTPQYIQAVPRDPFGDGAIHYRCLEDGVQVWSAGSEAVTDPGQMGLPDGRWVAPAVGWILLDPRHRQGAEVPAAVE